MVELVRLTGVVGDEGADPLSIMIVDLTAISCCA